MNNNRDVMTAPELSMPSGSEVEAATFHTPVVAEVTVVMPEHSRPDLKTNVMNKLDTFRTQSRMKLHDVQHLMSEKSAEMKHTLAEKSVEMKHTLTEKSAVMKTNLQRSMTQAKSTMNRSMNTANTTVHTGFNDMQSDMKVNPMKWAGIAAGSGFAIGLIGRFIHWRNKHRHTHAMPQLVIIESAC